MLLLTLTALAAEPTAGVHAVGAVTSSRPGGGAGGSVGLHLGLLDLELAGDFAVGPGAASFVRPQARLLPWGPDRIGPHLVAGAGVVFADGTDDGALGGGLGVDLGTQAWRPRVEAVGWAQRGGATGLLLTVGVGHRPRPTAPDLRHAGPPLDVAMVWVPGPVCEWLPPLEATDAFARIEADPAQVNTVPRPTGPSRATEDDTTGPTGDLVVAASPGDRVTVGEQRLDVAPDGIAWISLPEGPTTVRVLGGGRRDVFDVAVSDGATLWVTALAPETVQLRFEVGSAELEGPSALSLDAFADALGDWRVQVWGSYSVEGDRVANEALADARARSARDRLVVAGVPADRIDVLPPRTPAEGLPLEDQRIAVLKPVPAEAP